jgi:hypothetical protein
MFGWFKESKLNTIPDTKTAIGSYRISPDGMSFKVEIWEYSYGRLDWHQAGLYDLYGLPSKGSPCGTELECEKYIACKLKQQQGLKDSKRRYAEHAAKHPPREVPPYKLLENENGGGIGPY